MPGRDFVLSEAQLASLPIDMVGLEILKDVVANNMDNSRNWLLMAKDGGYSQPALDRCQEAWDWLHTAGLVGHNRLKSDAHWICVTRLGYEVARTADLQRMRAAARLSLELHPNLEAKVRPQFLMGEFELAAFAALRGVEVRVRELGSFSDSDIGVDLMRKAFGDGGPLSDMSLDKGERRSRMDLFAGAIGTLKNPSSHREVAYDNPTEASEVIMLADLLMRILDRLPRGPVTNSAS